MMLTGARAAACRKLINWTIYISYQKMLWLFYNSNYKMSRLVA